MRRRCGQALLIVMVWLLVTGCFAPPPPMFGDGRSVPEEVARIPLPVRPGANGTWLLNAPATGLLGQGRTLVRRESTESRGWQLALPPEFALVSDQPGTAHSALVRDHKVVLVGGEEGRRGPSAIAGLDPTGGRLSWRHELPQDSRVFMGQDSLEQVLASTCRPGSCRITAWEVWSGRHLWSRDVPGAVQVLDACQADGFAPGGNSCGPYVVTRDRIGMLDPEDGGLHWPSAVPLPKDGMIDRITRSGSRIVMATAPAEGSCRATVLAAGDTSADGDRGWQHTFIWDQPQATRDPRTGCHWDRTLPLIVAHHLVLPDAQGTLVGDPYFGTLRHSWRLAPGEYLITDGTNNTIIRAAARPDRLLNPTPGEAVRPRGLSTAARLVVDDFWQDGERLRLLGHEDETLWEDRSGCQAFAATPKGGPVTYCDGGDLVTVRPVPAD